MRAHQDLARAKPRADIATPNAETGAGIGSVRAFPDDVEFSPPERPRKVAPPLLSAAGVALPPLPRFRGVDPYALLGVPDPQRAGAFNVCAIVTDHDLAARHMAVQEILTAPHLLAVREQFGSALFYRTLDALTAGKRRAVAECARAPPRPLFGTGDTSPALQPSWARSTIELFRDCSISTFPYSFTNFAAATERKYRRLGFETFSEFSESSE
eukprot:gnl/Chilomastix_cuspidata/554.p1 GENE.gnl/Chilomastix_cuspidata/554~~gnl/Chilomastix_cuspidata/554.p1  ORF type:complete len:213 (+),score=81.20 gnl/Chilomastix_cuspidata/554:656-1294(+)